MQVSARSSRKSGKSAQQIDGMMRLRIHGARRNLYAEVLEAALGKERARVIMERLTATLQVRPFDFARKTEPTQILNFIQNEHPQTIALVLAYLKPEQASLILSALPPERQVDVAKRLATLDRTTPEVLEDIESTLEQRLSAYEVHDYTVAGGIDAAVEILNHVGRPPDDYGGIGRGRS